MKDFLEFTQTSEPPNISEKIHVSLDLVKLSRLRRSFFLKLFFTEKTPSFSIVIIPRGLSRAIHSQLNGSSRLLFETRRWRDCWQTQKLNIRLFVCCKLSRRKLNSARLTSLKWHRYHNWSYSLTRFRDISQAAKYLNISEYNFYSCCWQLSNTSMDSGRCKAYCKTEEKNGNCEGKNQGFAAILRGEAGGRRHQLGWAARRATPGLNAEAGSQARLRYCLWAI